MRIRRTTSVEIFFFLFPFVSCQAWSLGLRSSRLPVRSVLHKKRRLALAHLQAFSSDDEDFYGTSDEMEEEEELTDEELEESMGDWDDKIARFNTVHLTGRIGNDPEPRYFDDGKVVVNLSLANRRKYHNLERKLKNIKSGEEETDWYGLEIWGQTAEYVSKYVDKGMRVGVLGQLQVDTWTDKDTGYPRNRAKVVVRDFDILETRAETELRRSGRRGRSFYTNDDDDDDDEYSPSKAGTGGFFDM